MKDNQETIRLNKYIAQSGLCSRRKADEYISNGFISVNNKTITDLGYKIHLDDKVQYQGKILTIQTVYQYLLFNKPKDCITTLNDERDRKTVYDYIKKHTDKRLVPVGRLDRATTGLLLFTNDGQLHHDLTHPSSKVDKIYQATLDKKVTKADFSEMIKGAQLEDGFFKPDELALLEGQDKIGVQVHSGKNRIVRRFFEHFGYTVQALDRVFFAGLTKYKLPRSHCRFLEQNEVRVLKQHIKRKRKSTDNINLD